MTGLQIAKPFQLLLNELANTERYVTYTVEEYFIDGKRDANKVNVIVRADVDNGLALTVDVAKILADRKIRCSFYYLSNSKLHYDIWKSDAPKKVAELGIEVGLHTDHYFEEKTGGRKALDGIREDVKRLSELIGKPISGMVWHGHPAAENQGIWNINGYKGVPANDLGLRYHDGEPPYFREGKTIQWISPTDLFVSDNLFGYPNEIQYFPTNYLKTLQAAKIGQSVGLYFHTLYFFGNWNDVWKGDELEKFPSPYWAGLPNWRKKIHYSLGLHHLKYSKIRIKTGSFLRKCFEKFIVGYPPKLTPFFHLFYRKKSDGTENRSADKEREIIYENGIEYYENCLKELKIIPAEKVLEVGFGSGQWLIAMSKHCKEVFGIEPMEYQHEFTKQKIAEFGCQNIQLFKGGGEKLPFENQSFNSVFSYSVLTFCYPDKTISEMARVLKPGGRLYISTSGLGYFLRLMRDGIGFNQKQIVFYAWWITLNTILFRRILGKKDVFPSYYSYGDLRKLCEQNGLIVKEITTENLGQDRRWGGFFLSKPVYFRCIAEKPK